LYSIGVRRTSAPHVIDLQLAHLERRLAALVRGTRRMADRYPDPRHELAGAERLAHVIVGTGVEGRDLVVLLAPGREHDDGDSAPLPQATDDLEPVHVRQAEVDDDDVREPRADFYQAVGARRGLV
jgi:hypothetical protein